jgi:hypothetical protein
LQGEGDRWQRLIALAAAVCPADHRRKVAALSRMEFLQITAEDLADL